MSTAEHAVPGWPRQHVKVVTTPAWATLQDGPRPWLWLSGECSESLEADVRGLTQRFDHQWVWLDTAWQYESPGYQQGPMLVPLDTTLFNHFLETWAPQRAGLLLLGPDDEQELLGHLRQLRLIIAADGLPLTFSLGASRQLEELGESLPNERLAQLFGPIARLIWRAGGKHATEWLQADAPTAMPGVALADGHHLTLTPEDEATLDQASHAWFMRDTARLFTLRHPALASALTETQLYAQLMAFDREADSLALLLERDARHYMELRFVYPQALFAHDTLLRNHLTRRHVPARQRLQEAEERLQQIACP